MRGQMTFAGIHTLKLRKLIDLRCFFVVNYSWSWSRHLSHLTGRRVVVTPPGKFWITPCCKK